MVCYGGFTCGTTARNHSHRRWPHHHPWPLDHTPHRDKSRCHLSQQPHLPHPLSRGRCRSINQNEHLVATIIEANYKRTWEASDIFKSKLWRVAVLVRLIVRRAQGVCALFRNLTLLSRVLLYVLLKTTQKWPLPSLRGVATTCTVSPRPQIQYPITTISRKSEWNMSHTCFWAKSPLVDFSEHAETYFLLCRLKDFSQGVTYDPPTSLKGW